MVGVLSSLATATDENAKVRFWAAIGVLKLTGGAVDDPRIIVDGLRGYQDDSLNPTAQEDAWDHKEAGLKAAVAHGKGEAVGAVAREMLRKMVGQSGG